MTRKFIARPKAGEIVSFIVRHKSNVTLQYEDTFYENVLVLSSASCDPPNSFRIETPYWYRNNVNWCRNCEEAIISTLDIVQMGNEPIRVQSPSEARKEVKVPSSRGKGQYSVIVDTATRQGLSCSCPGFDFRKHCRHLDEAVKMISK